MELAGQMRVPMPGKLGKSDQSYKQDSDARRSETVPTGHSQPQNDLRMRSEIKKERGYQEARGRVDSRHLSGQHEVLQLHPSTPAGRSTAGVAPAVSDQSTQR